MTEKRFKVINGFDCENNPIKMIENTVTGEKSSMENELEANSVCAELNKLTENLEYLDTCFDNVNSTYDVLQEQYHNLEIALSKCRNENRQLKQERIEAFPKYLRPFHNLARDYNLTFEQLYEITKTAIEKGDAE